MSDAEHNDIVCVVEKCTDQALLLSLSKRCQWGGNITHFGGNHAPYLPTLANENYFQTCLRIQYKYPSLSLAFIKHDH